MMTHKRFFCRLVGVLALLSLLLTMAFSVSADGLLYDFPETEEETIVSPSAMLLYMGIRPEQDIILYEKEADVRYEPGSLMRVAMLGYAMKLITEQNIDIDTETAEYTLYQFNHYVAGTGLHVALMNFGETWTLRDLLTVCAIQTAADCAVALATKLSGTPEAFVEGLNAFAQELGCTNSHFTNVMGLNEEGQYMSARDVMTFTRYAMQYPAVAAMLELTSYKVTPVSGGSARSWPNSNDMLRSSTAVYYTYAVGGHTGGTPTEMSLVEYGSMDGYDYMAVAMGAPKTDEKGNLTNQAYRDARLLIRWGLLDFAYEPLLRQSEPVAHVAVANCADRDYVSLVPTGDLGTVVKKGTDLTAVPREIVYTKTEFTAPIQKGEVLATMTLLLDGKRLASVPLAAAEDAPYSGLTAFWTAVGNFVSSGWMVLILCVLLLLVGGYIFLVIRYNRRKGRKFRS